MRRLGLAATIALILAAFVHSSPRAEPTPAPAASCASVAVPVTIADAGAVTPTTRVVTRAREEVTRRVSYDPSWFAISYPNGDPSPSVGVCTDVVIRSYRAAGIDFQKLVHEDVVRNTAAYDPWVKVIDANIDHRRVGPLMTYLSRHAKKLSNDDNASYAAGDIVVISFNACPRCSPQHIGVVSDKLGPRGVPLMIHNMGPVPSEDDTLDAWTRIGHYRVL